MQPEPLENMENDAVKDASAKSVPVTMIVCQNNEKQSVKIKQVSEGLAEALDYRVSDLEGIDLERILGENTRTVFVDGLEYEDDAPDLEDVLKHVAGFRLKNSSNEEVPYILKILRDEARDQHHWFRLILSDERREMESNSVINALHSSMAGVRSVDEVTGLADHHCAEQYLQMAQRYVQTHGVSACFAVVRIDRHPKNLAQYGKDQCIELLKHVASCCKTKFRANDVVCQLSDHTVGLLMFDISYESARVVLNRLRWFIRKHHIQFGGKSNFSVTVSVAFTALHKDEERDVLALTEQIIADTDSEERSLLIELDGE